MNALGLRNGLATVVVPWSFRRMGEPMPSWSGYLRLVHELAPYIRAKLPRAAFTTSFSSGALTRQSLRPARALLHDLDALAITSYDAGPGTGRFTASLDRVLALYPDKPVVFQEIGFAAPPGDEALHVAFVEEVFEAWHNAGARVPYVGFFSLHDWYQAPEPCDAPHSCDACDPGCIPAAPRTIAGRARDARRPAPRRRHGEAGVASVQVARCGRGDAPMSRGAFLLLVGGVAVACGGVIDDRSADSGTGSDASIATPRDAGHDTAHEASADDASVDHAYIDASASCPPITDAPKQPLKLRDHDPLDKLTAASGGLVVETTTYYGRGGTCTNAEWWPFGSANTFAFGASGGCDYGSMEVRGAEAWGSASGLSVFDLGPGGVSPAYVVNTSYTSGVVAGPSGVVYQTDKTYFIKSRTASPIALDAPAQAETLAVGDTDAYASAYVDLQERVLWQLPLSGAKATQIASAVFLSPAYPVDHSLVFAQLTDSTQKVVALRPGGSVEVVRELSDPFAFFPGVEVDASFI